MFRSTARLALASLSVAGSTGTGSAQQPAVAAEALGQLAVIRTPVVGGTR